MKIDFGHTGSSSLVQNDQLIEVGSNSSKDMLKSAALLPAENWQNVASRLDPKSFVALSKVNRHIHNALLGQVVEKQIQNTENLAAFEKTLSKAEVLPFLPATKCLIALAERVVAIEDENEAKTATRLWVQAATRLKAGNAESSNIRHQEFHSVINIMAEVESNYAHYASHYPQHSYRHPQAPIISKIVDGSVGDQVRRGLPVDEVMADNNIRNASLQIWLEWESVNGPAGESVHAREISWENALVKYGIADASPTASQLEAIGFFRIWDQ